MAEKISSLPTSVVSGAAPSFQLVQGVSACCRTWYLDFRLVASRTALHLEQRRISPPRSTAQSTKSFRVRMTDSHYRVMILSTLGRIRASHVSVSQAFMQLPVDAQRTPQPCHQLYLPLSEIAMAADCVDLLGIDQINKLRITYIT